MNTVNGILAVPIEGLAARKAKYKPHIVGYNACECTLYSVPPIANRQPFNRHSENGRGEHG